MKRKPAGFIVVYDDDCGLCVPMGWDADCDGAICSTHESIALFATRSEAQTAIRISTAFASLQQLQRLPCNYDFIESLKKIKIVPLTAKEPPA